MSEGIPPTLKYTDNTFMLAPPIMYLCTYPCHVVEIALSLEIKYELFKMDLVFLEFKVIYMFIEESLLHVYA